MIATFPVNIIASTAGFKPEEGLKVDDAGSALSVSAEEMKDPQVKLN